MKTYHFDQLSPWELRTLITWAMQKLSPKDREDLMKTLPSVYDKLCGIDVVEVHAKRLDPLAD